MAPTFSCAVMRVLGKRGFSIMQIVEILGLTNQEMVDVIHGRRELLAPHLLKLAHAAGLPLGQLLAAALGTYSDPEEAGEAMAVVIAEAAAVVKRAELRKRGGLPN